MTPINWHTIERVIYINLNKRKDRRVRMDCQLEKLGIPGEKIIRLEAVAYTPGYIGCSRSHVLALEMAQENNWKNVLILEDYIEFHHDEGSVIRLNKYLSALDNVAWDVAFLAANYLSVLPLSSVDYIVRPQKAWCACAYLVNGHYYEKLLANYRQSLTMLMQGGKKNHFALDVHWYELMAVDCWLGVFPNLGYQAVDDSDIEGVRVDYRASFAKPLSAITSSALHRCEEKIKVDFYFQWAPNWTNFESVLQVMQNNAHFDCQVVVMPYLALGHTGHDCEAQRELLVGKNIDFVDYQDYSLTERRPHVVFLQNPYDEARLSRFTSEYLQQHGVNIAYIPYGLDMGDGDMNRVCQYNMPCHNLARWVFVRSARHKAEYGYYCEAGNQHVYVTGHPKFDRYAERYGSHTTRNSTGKRKTLLWTPHFVTPGNEKMWSTFNYHTQAMLDILARNDVDMIIRPHPLFKQFLNVDLQAGNGDKTQQNFQRLVNFSENNPHVSWDFSADYSHAFAQSDAIMTNPGSFLLEYLPSHKPILYLTHPDCLGINSSADFIYDAYDIATDAAEIMQFVDNVIHDRDPCREKRLQVLRDELYISPRGAGHEITEIIQQAFRREEG